MNFCITPSCEDHTLQLQNAIDDCFSAGGGTVTVENGEYHIKSIRLRSNVTLYLKSGVSLIATRDIEAYNIINADTVEPLPECEKTDVLWSKANPARNNDFIRKCGSRWTNAIIRLAYAHNAKVIAEEGAVIDGCNSFDETGEEHYRGVHGISMYHCHDLEFRGYTIKDTGNWAHCGYFCQNLTFSGITVLAGHDGVHTGGCDNVLVENCKMYTGDDCVAGFDICGLTVRNCLLNTACSAFRLGGTNVLIEDCSFSFATPQTELIRAANFARISIENVTAQNVSGSAVTSWGGNGELTVTDSCGFKNEIAEATEPFHTRSI